MNKKKLFVLLLLTVLSVMILIGVAIMWYFLQFSRGDSYELNITVNGEKEVAFNDLYLIPGESEEYVIKLRSDLGSQYHLKVKFVEEGDQALKYYAYARIEIGDEVICDRRLEELFNGETVSFDCYLSNDEPYEVKFTYYMPLEIGNEAENAVADFKILIYNADREAE